MNFEEKLKKCSAAEIWQEYCGFLDLSMPEYMTTQKRLLLEQINLLAGSGLGRRFFGDRAPATVEEFRERVPLTSYDDYADVLLLRRADMLPAPPVVWLKTTWEGGSCPAKWAPYGEAMLRTYTQNILAAMLLCTSDRKGSFHVRPGSRVLYSLAPMPYATGLFPDLIEPQIGIKFLPPVAEARRMSFHQQSKKGYEMGIKGGMNLFFGMSSVLYGASRNLESLLGSSGGQGGRARLLVGMKPSMLVRILRARYRAKRDGTPILPKDLFKLDGFVCVGTDTSLYKDELEQMWGRRPMEMAGGTEPSCLGAETWSKNGLVFFPDADFYEFIPEQEMQKNLHDPSYSPRTYLMDELVAGQKYELVLTSLKGGAFVRYRVGDVFRCVRLKNPQDGLDFPQFEYVDRIPTVIDIAGFTRITRREIDYVIGLSGLAVADWFAAKEYDENNHSYLHLYAEMQPGRTIDATASREILEQHLGIYFRYYDEDMTSLKKLLGVDPLQVTVLHEGTMRRYGEKYGRPIDKVNPPREEILSLLELE